MLTSNTKSTSPTVINSTSTSSDESLGARFDVAQVCDSWYYTKREGVKVGRGEVGTWVPLSEVEV